MAVSVDTVRNIAAPIVSAAKLDLEDITVDRVGRRDKVCVIVDADGGVDLDVIAKVSGDISTALDGEPQIEDAPFVLEVTSPGVDRPLTEARHWRRAHDRLVVVDMTDGRTVKGRVVSSDDRSATVAVSGEMQQIPYDDVSKAVVEVEFDRKKDT
ncbi:MAG: ribosome maturation factor RimP [Actinobacteria bacterium]|nr:ribosome maturation factor RimP [Actinomycetota bacterium]NDH15033.1 ribosome maturation factor RimP [Actinomycetota bacterium]